MIIKKLNDLNAFRENGLHSIYPEKIKITVGMATCGLATGAQEVYDELRSSIAKKKLDIVLSKTGCIGFCQKEPIVEVIIPGAPRVIYGEMNAEKTREILPLLLSRKHKNDYLLCKIEVETLVDEIFRLAKGNGELSDVPAYYHEVPFFAKQKKIALRNCGFINPDSIEEYIARGGYFSLHKVLRHFTPDSVIEEVKKSGIRGRGGAGFPTGIKWESCRRAESEVKYIICNADEGDPGAYMDRSILEGDPHSVIEGMIIGAYAIGATRGFIYVRTEYPLAVVRLHDAIRQAREVELLGDNIFNSSFSFDIEIREGSGAFVCGEETALMHSIEGVTPEPRQRPPFPVQSGLWGFPTVINNVETWSNIPVILQKGGQWFSRIGTEKSKGTKVFSVVGKINNTGLVEIPMGMTLKEIIYDIGGGIPQRKSFKAVQTGGPSGGCIPAELIDLPVDYDELMKAGSIMGSGGMVVMDEDTCMVDVAKFFTQFTNDESCGKCTACRDGSEALLEVLTRITDGDGKEGDIEFLEELGSAIKDASMCGLGTTLPNPVLSTLRYFRDEYEAHIKFKSCPAVVCRGIISSPCQYLCPLHTDVPAYLTLIAEGKFEEALDVIRKTNPLPIICGRVCMAHCEEKCKAKESGGSLSIRELKRFLTDWELRSGKLPEVSPFPRKYDESVAIIGSGPAGLTAGYELVQKGYAVTIFEKLPVAGGMLAVGIPDYRLPKKLLQMEIETIQKAGVEIRTNSPVENVADLLNDGYQAVLISIGAHKIRKLGIHGEDVTGVVDPIAYLRKVSLGETPPALGNKVGIIGGGDTAIDTARTILRLGLKEVTMLDTARTALRMGAKDATIFYRRTRSEMPAVESEVEAALEEGVRIEFLVAPTRIISERGKLTGLELVRTALGYPDASGRRQPIPIEGSKFVVELDSLLPAISPTSEIPESFEVRISEQNTVIVDPETFVTSKKNVFACGDVATGPADVTTAMANAKIAAESVHKYLRGEDFARKYEPIMPSVVVEPILVEEEIAISRSAMPKLTVDQRKRNFDEVELGYTREMAMKEASRCLRCDWETRRLKRKMNEA
jgi:NADH-quinone oxidoreductase subunit F